MVVARGCIAPSTTSNAIQAGWGRPARAAVPARTRRRAAAVPHDGTAPTAAGVAASTTLREVKQEPEAQMVAQPEVLVQPAVAPSPHPDETWPRKSSLYILRTDGKSCSRELVTGQDVQPLGAMCALPCCCTSQLESRLATHACRDGQASLRLSQHAAALAGVAQPAKKVWWDPLLQVSRYASAHCCMCTPTRCWWAAFGCCHAQRHGAQKAGRRAVR